MRVDSLLVVVVVQWIQARRQGLAGQGLMVCYEFGNSPDITK
jgi:hypothetical protein